MENPSSRDDDSEGTRLEGPDAWVTKRAPEGDGPSCLRDGARILRRLHPEAGVTDRKRPRGSGAR
jgi:hypothetical protein